MFQNGASVKSLGLSYILCLLAFAPGLAGIHRFYLGKPISGLLYLLTWGFFGIGTVLDLIRLPFIVDQINFRYLTRANKLNYFPENRNFEGFSSPERQILKVAKRHQGRVSVQIAALETSLSLEQAKIELERLRKEGFCSKDVTEDGAEVFFFFGLDPNAPVIS